MSLHRPLAQQNAWLLNVSFYAMLHTITGAMIIDCSLKSAYDSILTRALEDPFFMEHQTSLHMSTWPNSARGMTLLTDSDSIQELITTTKWVILCISFFPFTDKCLTVLFCPCDTLLADAASTMYSVLHCAYHNNCKISKIFHLTFLIEPTQYCIWDIAIVCNMVLFMQDSIILLSKALHLNGSLHGLVTITSPWHVSTFTTCFNMCAQFSTSYSSMLTMKFIVCALVCGCCTQWVEQPLLCTLTTEYQQRGPPHIHILHSTLLPHYHTAYVTDFIPWCAQGHPDLLVTM